MCKSSNHAVVRSTTERSALKSFGLGMCLLASLGASGAAQAKKHHHDETVAVTSGKVSDGKPAAESKTEADSDTVSHYSMTLEELGAVTPIELHSVNGQRNLSLSVRNDAVITAAKLRLFYAWSPALIPELSHLKVMLNDELMTSLPLPHEGNNGHVSEIQLDPSMFIDFNQLKLGLIAHYTRDCEDPMHSSLWANVSNQSRIDLTVKHLKNVNDLALLPAPFFDNLDHRKLNLPMVFSAMPNNAVLHAAGVVASWFGSLASYRGATFPVTVNSLPKGNAVVMIVGNAAPDGLSVPPVNGPSLAVVDNPLNAHAKLLLVMGRDASELDVAALGLTLGKATLTGAFTEVSHVQDVPARKPYDAPNWIPTDRAVHLGELNRLPALQVEGLNPDAIRLDFRMPPDLFTWRSAGVPLDLHYRYTPRPTHDRSNFNVNINGMFVHSMPLASFPNKLEKTVNLVVPEERLMVSKQHMLIPHEKFSGRNQLQLQYFFDYSKEGSCKDVFLNNERGVVDSDSTIDFSSFSHYTALPNLEFFTHDGFPFTRLADLAETAIVMPDGASSTDIETYLTVMGRMGNVTGYPSIRHAVIAAAGVDGQANKDLILIGTAGNQPLLARWANKMHPLLESGSHNLRLPGPFERLKSRWDNRDLDDALHRAGDLLAKGGSGLGALVAFESPLKSGRSVVVFTGDDADKISTLATSLSDPKLVPSFHGDLVLQSGKRVEGFQMGPSYYVGELTLWQAVRWYASKQPLLLIMLLVVAASLVSVVAFRTLRKIAAQRIGK